ncbi:putative ankyrin repeat protein [Colletotrichum tabaci]|uniref:Ankyrin repeat protein n=1 Tax=Colletotrichum tabaci TaxID=1209068 RepID=A0AAV9STF2_9PEZI
MFGPDVLPPTDQAGRMFFELSEIHTPHAACKLRLQCWLVIDSQNPTLEHVPHIASTYRGGNPLLGISLSGLSAVFWAVKGRPRVILKLKTYDYHVKARRKNHSRTQFLQFVLPFVLTIEEKARSFVRRAWKKGTM